MAGISTKVSSRHAWTRENSASACRAHAPKSSDGQPHRPLATRRRTPSPRQQLRPGHAEWPPPRRWRRQTPRHPANHPSSKRQPAALATAVVTANSHNGSHQILPLLPLDTLYRGRGGVRIRGRRGQDSPSIPPTISASSKNIKHLSWKQNPNRKVVIGATWCLGVTGKNIEQQKYGKSRGFNVGCRMLGTW